MVSIKVKWGKETYNVDVEPSSTVRSLRDQLYKLSAVPVEKQKIMGMKPAGGRDDATIEEAGLTNGKTLMLIGSAEGTAIPTAQSDANTAPAVGGHSETKASSNGLQNIANTCYMNAALQMLRSIPEIKESLAAYRGANPLLKQLHDLLVTLDGTKEAVPPLLFWTTLVQMNPVFGERDEHGGFMQQDAQEVLNFLLQQIAEALPEKYAHLFRGDLQQTLTREDGSSEPGKEAVVPFTMLSCNINGEVQTLEAGLEHAFNEAFTTTEGATQQETKFTRVSRVAELPEYVFVHMVRFSWRSDTQKKAKILKPITFPVQLDLYHVASAPLQEELKPMREKIKVWRDEELEKRKRGRNTGAQDEKSHPAETVPLTLHNESGYYELCGVISHKGRSAESGHYVYWGKKAGTWLIFDDKHVAAVSEEDVKRLRGVGEAHIAYVLLYRSRDPMSKQPVIPL